MKRTYFSEIEGMVEFYQELQITPSYELNTDGVIKGTLIEFKKTESVDGGIGHHKEQVKRYLRAYNSAAKDIPSISILIYLNSAKFIKIDNETDLVIEEGKWNSPAEFKEFLINNDKYIKGYIDEFSIVAYNNRFCEQHNGATKEDVKKEFTNPDVLNIKPFDWDGQIKDEETVDSIGWLHFNMNQLGNVLLKKQLGAFFTPEQYVEISTRYVRSAIKRSIDEGFEDYIIVDRCAGTGNLERFLSNEELSHCILNTFDYTEWTTLKGLYDGRVREIIPPTNDGMTENGLLPVGNALSMEFNDHLKNILVDIDRNKTYIIFLENPPFRDETSTLTSKDKKSRKNKTYVDELMNDDPIIKGAMKNELSLKFIWSAWNIYEPDEYILYSPIKYWKTYHLFDKVVLDGFITDKKDYNAHYNAGLPVIRWLKEDVVQEDIKLENGSISKIHNSIKTLLDKTKHDNPIAKMFIQAGEIRPIGTSLDNGKQVINDTPASLVESNILEQLPLWAAAKYDPKDLELNILMKSGDGKNTYKADKDFLIHCLIWSSLTNKNKCVSDGERTNEMALRQGSRVDKILSKSTGMIPSAISTKWDRILGLVREADEFNPDYKYGLHQIEKEINIKVWKGSLNKKQEQIMEFKYPELRDQIKYFKVELKDYYKKLIEPKIFKYQLIK